MPETEGRFYYFDLVYRHADTGATPSMGGGADSLEEAKRALMKEVAYYHSIGCSVVDWTIGHSCRQCGGTGSVTITKGVRKMRHVRERCPACKGKDSDVRVV